MKLRASDGTSPVPPPTTAGVTGSFNSPDDVGSDNSAVVGNTAVVWISEWD